MADEDNKKQAPSEGQEDKQTKSETKSEDWGTILGESFKGKTAEDVAKSYKELEKKLGEQGAEVKEAREFATTVAPLLEEIKNDPEIFEKLDKRLREKNSPENKNKPETKQDKKDDELRQVASDLLINRFESSHGMLKLSPDELEKIRGKIGSTVLELTGQSVKDVDLRRLGTVLEKAYILATQDGQSKSEDSDSDIEDDGAGISAIPSSKGGGAPKLTPEQALMAEKLGLTREQYLSGIRK